MDRKNRTLETLLDAREEVMLVGLLKSNAEAEDEIEQLRQQLCSEPGFDPYACFKMLTSGTALLSAFDLGKWLNKQYYKNTMLCDMNCANVFKTYCSSGTAGSDDRPFGNKNPANLLKYEDFLKLVLPREDKGARNLVMCRRYSSFKLNAYELSKEAGFLLVRLLELESNLFEEATMRKKRLLEYEWRENKKHFPQRSFTWLQSQSAVPGQTHVSVLGVCRLLNDVKEVLSIVDVERLFHRVNVSGTDMLSYLEWEKFLASDEASAFLNELYVKYFTTTCPGCGAMVQRDGGACNNVTCAVCRTTFRCDTKTLDAPPVDGPDLPSGAGRGSLKQNASIRRSKSNKSAMLSTSMRGNNSLNRSAVVSSKSTNLDYTTLSRKVTGTEVSPKRAESLANYREKQATHTAGLMSPRAGLAVKAGGFSPPARTGSQKTNVMNTTVSTAASGFDDSMDRSYSASNSPAARKSNRPSTVLRSAMTPRSTFTPTFSTTVRHKSPLARQVQSDDDLDADILPLYQVGSVTSSAENQYQVDLKRKRQQESLNLVLDAFFQQIDLDNFLEREKEKLWQDGINIEAAFSMLDRNHKGHVSDTDVWQIMHGSEFQGGCTFSGVCALFREQKQANTKKPGQLSLAELTQFLFPRQAEEWVNVKDDMSDEETKNVLFVVRSTISCPGCGLRTQRTVEGCPQVTCPACRTGFRCNLIGDDRDHQFRLTMTQRHKLRAFIKLAVDCAEEHEKLRKELAYSSESLSSILLDAFLLLSQDKGYVTFQDMKRLVLAEKAVRATDIELLWWRYARDGRRIGFVEFGQKLRPFGHN